MERRSAHNSPGRPQVIQYTFAGGVAPHARLRRLTGLADTAPATAVVVPCGQSGLEPLFGPSAAGLAAR